MKVSFCKYRHNEVRSPLNMRSGLVGLVAKGHSDTDLAPCMTICVFIEFDKE